MKGMGVAVTTETTRKKLDAAVVAHSRWKRRLTELLELGKNDFDVATIAKSDACQFGKWLNVYQPTPIELAHFHRVREIHAEFHRTVSTIVQMVNDGQRAEAAREMMLGSPYVSLSAGLTREMMSWNALLS